MKKHVIIILGLLLLFCALSADYTIDFESESKASYDSGDVALSGITWNMSNALIGNLANDKKNGTKSARIKTDGSMTMLTDKSGGIGTISLYYAKYGTDSTAPTFRVEYSTNAGADWTQVGTDFNSNLQSDLTYWSGDINVTGDVRVRITAISGTTDKRGNIDDILMTDFGEYYETAAGLTGSALKDELHSIIDGHTFYDYDGVKTALQVLDEDPDNSSNVIGIYTGWSIDKTNFNTSNGWNREHVWAKSHGNFDIDESPGTDLHHLRPEDSTVNTMKLNRDFAEGGSEYIDGDGATGCYWTTDTWEPPDDVKGDVARMMFYMDVRYEGDNGEVDLELVDAVDTDNPDTGDLLGEHGKLTTLLKWHAEDPVSEAEEVRNQAIYDNWQHNRNPFIDHPEYVWEIWGTPTLSANPTTLDFGSVSTGQASDETYFDLTGEYLVDNVTVTAPDDFEISTTSGSGFTGQLVLSPTGRDLFRRIYVRFVPTSVQGYNATITCSSTQSENETISVIGSGIDNGSSGTPAIINEWSQGDGGSKEWVEIVVVQDNLDMRGWVLSDESDPYCTFLDGAGSPWASVPEGTVIVIYNGGDRDTNLPVDDLVVVEAGNKQVVSAHNQASLFINNTWSGFSNNTSTDNPKLTDGATRAIIHDWDQGNNSAFTSIRPAGSTAIYYTAGTDEGVSTAANWTSAAATSPDVTPATGNGGSNSEWLEETLPVQLSSFTATISESDEVLIQWITQSESDMLGYNLLRSEVALSDNAIRINMDIIPAENQSCETVYEYGDPDIQSETTYFYWLESISANGHSDFFGPREVTVTEDDPGQAPDPQSVTQLLSNYPNPFNPSTEIDYSLVEAGHVTIEVFNLKGQLIRTLVDQPMTEGTHKVEWLGEDQSGKPVGSGIYLYRMKTDNYISTRKMLMIQ